MPSLFSVLRLKKERVMQAQRDDAELRRKQEIHEAEESKNAHIQDLMRKHEKVSDSKKKS